MDNLLIYAEARGHRVVFAELPVTGSLSYEEPDTGICVIGIDPSLPPPVQLVRMAHELTHGEKAGFYSEECPHIIRAKIEHRAKAGSYEATIPPCAIRQALSSGAVNHWELAEYLTVPEDFLLEALTYYRDAKGITFGEDMEP